MKTKDLTTLLNGLLGNSMGGGATTSSPSFGPVPGNYDDAIPSELETAPVFELNYKSELKQCIKKAKDSLLIMVKGIVPIHLLNTALILDKVNQDAELLGNLYYLYKKKETYHQALMNTIACGLTDAKRFEVCEKISTSLEDLGSKITELQNQLRKFYIDTYLDILSKDDADEIADSKRMSIENNEVKSITNNAPELLNIITGTDETVKILAEKKKQALMKKYQEMKKETEN